jgi:hypothetical protein
MKTMKSDLATTLLLLTLLAAVALPSCAGDQKLDPRAPYALIFGTVYGPDDRPARHVPIKIRRQGEKKAIDLLSDNNGEFAQRFPAGKADYLVWADLKDRQAAQNTQVKVHIENDERQDLTLHLPK